MCPGDVLTAVASGAKSLPNPAEQKQKAAPESLEKPAEKQQKQSEKQAAKPAPEQRQQQHSSAAPPMQHGDSQIRGILAKKLMEDGKPIPAQWLVDWAGNRMQQQQN